MASARDRVATAFDPRVALAWIDRVRPEGEREQVRDGLAVEEPLEIRVDGAPLAVTMRTPGEDEELAVGFLAGEGLIAASGDIASVGPSDDLAANVVEVRTAAGLRRDPAGERRFYLTSSCGVCGKGALEFVRGVARPEGGAAEGDSTGASTPDGTSGRGDSARGGSEGNAGRDGNSGDDDSAERDSAGPDSGARFDADGGAGEPARIAPEVVLALPDHARSGQAAFERTGGLHATALFTAEGALVDLREDVGRHNAMDKALGALLLDGRYPVPPGEAPLFACLSGRASFELVQKAAVAGLAGLVAVGAPSTLAVDLARDHDMLLCGFVRDGSFNLYAGADRLAG